MVNAGADVCSGGSSHVRLKPRATAVRSA